METTLTVKQLQKIKTAFKASKDVQIQLSYDQLTNTGPNKILLSPEQHQKIEKCLKEGKNKITKNQHPTGVKLVLSPDATELCSAGRFAPTGGILGPLLETAARTVASSVTSLIENEAAKVPILGTILKHQKASGELAEIARKAREAPSLPLPTVNGLPVDRKMLLHMFPVDGGRLGSGARAQFLPLSTKDFIKDGIPVFMRDMIPPDTPVKTQYGVVNHDSINGKGTHWVCFFQHVEDGAVYYFDPYGNANPPKELVRVFEDREIRYNKEQVQRMDEDHPICGHLCIAFLKMMEEGQPAGEVIKSLKDNHLTIARSIMGS